MSVRLMARGGSHVGSGKENQESQRREGKGKIEIVSFSKINSTASLTFVDEFCQK
jgi:hypothetical protein